MIMKSNPRATYFRKTSVWINTEHLFYIVCSREQKRLLLDPYWKLLEGVRCQVSSSINSLLPGLQEAEGVTAYIR